MLPSIKNIVLKSIFIISSSLIFLFLNLNSGIKTSEVQNKNLTDKSNCEIESVTLKTERIEKKRKFLFWTLRHKKVIVIDRIIDQNGNQIFEKKSIFISSMDASDTRKLNRIKIVENEIWIFNHEKNYKVRQIKRYNYCGEFIGIKTWKNGDYYEN